MTERISIFNYEAFYLDFLEGNLSERDTALLMEFFEKHPELKMEDEALISMEPEPAPTVSFKQELKQPDLISDTITPTNLDDFLIADLEGELSPEKTAELSRYIIQNESAQVEKRRVVATKLAPDYSLVFSDKGALKKRAAIVPMWSYVAAAAAVLLLLVNVGLFNQSSVSFGEPYAWLEEEIGAQIMNYSANTVGITNNEQENEVVDAKTNLPQKRRNKPTYSKKEGIALMAVRKDFDIAVTKPIDKVAPLKVVSAPSKIEPTVQPQVAQAVMKNPIKPITNRLSEVTNTEIDFKKTAKSDKKNTGFFIKIGNIEVSRTSRR